MRTLRWTLLAILVLLGIGWLVQRARQPGVDPGSALVLRLEGELVDAPDAPPIARLLGVQRRSLLSVLSELRKAQRDERLAHVVLEIGDLEIGWAKAQELRDAIQDLREAGRHPVALLGVAGFGANLEYYVASAAEQVYLQPGSGPPLIGLAEEHMFLGGVWERYDIAVAVGKAGKYKGAAEQLTGHEMSAPYREQAASLLDSIDTQFVSGIAEARGLSAQDVRRALALASSRPETLKALALVDGESSRDELIETLGAPPVVEGDDYAAIDAASVGFDPVATFALVYASGTVVQGEGQATRTGQPVAAADTVAKALETAAEDDSVQAIVLRIDSPGGGSFPSETIWRAVRAARAHKPVVASFSDYAASGGYYLGSAADAVVAQPGTITGSIGVFAVRPSFGAFLARFGVATETMERAPHAELNLATPPLSADTEEWLEREVGRVYELFLDRVGEGRGLEVPQVDVVAQGRVWTGEQAVEHGLVDRLGGLRAAVRVAKQRAGIDEDADVGLAVYPPPRPLAEQIAESLRLSAVHAARSALPFDAGHWPDAGGRVSAWFGAVAEGGALLLPPVWIEIR
ncbi:signal peptide peptidase SppA [Myxococcota bacterium]|nr:signal peptide peptidase SppA [Myxococcota bacterium]MCZ7617690.1 signal peptide peptidase SppA [Myxococcota bacterium]